MNAKELSQALGVSPMAITNWTREGMPHRRSKNRGRSNEYDFGECLTWARENGKALVPRLDRKAEGALTADTQNSELAEMRVRRERAMAEKLERENAVRAGELIDRAGSERAQRQIARTLRDALVETLPTRLAPELAAIVDVWSLECRLRDAIRGELRAICDVLTDEAQWLQKSEAEK
ncbi:terminase small subunit [Methylocaldum sp.]|jgi:phage terminase Nu1 subunit (DNA packaging protein)|uniref:terminase small subunit n=1 Tax=Methylocaldum sp. TaxID=1969727 RepID=UPI00321F68DC